MKPYGVRRQDRGCCPGHDKYPGIEYRCTRIAGIRRRDKHAKTAARARGRREIQRTIEGLETTDGQ